MLLALDTTGPFCSAALHDGENIHVLSEELGRGHAERLMPLIEELLAAHDIAWKEVSAVATTTGPGSFTGLRVGMAAARGLSLALDCPCYGVSVFEAFAHGVSNPLAVTMDAKRDQVWMQVFNIPDEPHSEPQAISLDQAVAAIPTTVDTLVGSAAPILVQQNNRFTVLNDNPSPPIENVARVALAMDTPSAAPRPLYLRAPDAKPQASALVR